MQQEATVLSPRSPRAHMPETCLTQVLAPALNEAGRVLGASECCLDPEHVGVALGHFFYLLIKYAHRKHQLCAALGYMQGRSFIPPSFLQ